MWISLGLSSITWETNENTRRPYTLCLLSNAKEKQKKTSKMLSFYQWNVAFQTGDPFGTYGISAGCSKAI